MHHAKILCIFLIILTVFSTAYAAPMGDVADAGVFSRQKRAVNGDARKPKKDIFVSRGWGAGGMPFNVLYMNRARVAQGSKGGHLKASRPQNEPKASARRGRIAQTTR